MRKLSQLLHSTSGLNSVQEKGSNFLTLKTTFETDINLKMAVKRVKTAIPLPSIVSPGSLEDGRIPEGHLG